MSETKVRRHYRLTKELDDTVRQLAEKNGVPMSSIIEKSVRYYIDNKGRDYKPLYEIIDIMFQETRDEINRTRAAANDIKNDTQAIMQFWNDRLLEEGKEDIVLIKDKESESVKRVKEEYQKELSKKRKRKITNTK